ncbi:MAG: ATP-binding protein [Planctomycetes bacterium]|nr:ATP-binding protein [Planctomycetota bacterium]
MKKTITVSADVGREISQISGDFTNPIEVLREALHNAHDAGATKVHVEAAPQKMKDGRRALTLQISDDGIGMSESGLEKFFGLGHSEKASIPGRRSIGFKGHGTKIFYQAAELFVATKQKNGILRVAVVEHARNAITARQLPRPAVFEGDEAQQYAASEGYSVPTEQGTIVRLIDFTADSNQLIDTFKTDRLENYVRWFTVYGSFEHIVNNAAPAPPFQLSLAGTDRGSSHLLPFGHRWPPGDDTDLKTLKSREPRRPFNNFVKTFRFPNRSIEGGYTIDVAALFEGKSARLKRDPAMSRQRTGGLYSEEERYGLWLCRDFIPIEKRFDWLYDDDCPKLAEDLRRPLIFVNCQEFTLIANRGSVGNSSQQLLNAVKKEVFSILREMLDDPDLERFLNEYQEDAFSRKREKDRKALHRRIERYNQKQFYQITLPGGRTHDFFEPTREITLFGLLCELRLLDKDLVDLDILDYDDHSGIDLLVRRNGNPADLLDKTKVSYVELKYLLTAQLNHAFDSLYAVVCWDLEIKADEFVTDAANNQFQFKQHKDKTGVTYCQLSPLPGNKLSHNVQVIVLKQRLQERFNMQMKPNPRPINRQP